MQWESITGRRVEVTSTRLVSFEHKHLFAIQYVVKALNFSGRIRLQVTLDGRVKNLEAGNDPRVGSSVSGSVLELIDSSLTAYEASLTHRVRRSGLVLISATATEITQNGDGGITEQFTRNGQVLEQRYDLQLQEGQQVELTKFGSYVSSRDYPESELIARTSEVLASARAAGFEALCASQERYLSAFWQRADVEIEGDQALQQGIRFNQFQLLQSVGKDGKTSIAAKGVTGEGYEGHYFWDTEIYVLPFFLYAEPAIARSLLDYRARNLDGARLHAREMSHAKGALYPWRTIAGEECSAYFPAGTAQYHINADIAYAVKLYVEVTGDHSFLLEGGAEMVMETARIWMGLGHYNPNKGNSFCIDEVTGPDEYSALVNNNYYTNAMASTHLGFAADIAEKLGTSNPTQFAAIARAMELEPDEPAQWRRAAEHMYLPYDEARGIHPQDDTFLDKKVWDIAATPRDHFPLLLHYHPLVIYRHQVCKQADVVLALMLLSERFTLDEKRRDFDYYEAVTTHDSSLSACVFGIIASEVGYREKAYDYFMETARMDLDNSHGNTQYGVHTAAMAGSWMGLVYGFAGLRAHSGTVSFSPTLPEQWGHYRFKIRVGGQLLQVQVEKTETEYRLLEGDALSIDHCGRPLQLNTVTSLQRAENSR